MNIENNLQQGGYKMLTRVTLENFKSFQNKTTIDFTKTNYSILPQNVTNGGVLKGCIFVGANASGKSNIITSIKLLLDLLFLERNINSGIFLCMFGSSTRYCIEYEFKVQDHLIRYAFGVEGKKSSITEHLYLDDSLQMERMGLSAKSYIADTAGIMYDSDDIGEDTLFLRTLYFNTKFASNEVLNRWMEYLKGSIYLNMFAGIITPYGNADVAITSYLDRLGCDPINEFFHAYNFQQHIEYGHSSEGGNIRITKGRNETDKTIFFKREGINVPIPFSEESLGNQNLLRILPAFLSVIKHGGMLLIDEFSSGFHNELESLMVRYFMETAENAQLIFVSHSTNLLSNALLRPDQEYAVEFREGIGSVVRRFSSEQPRSAQNVEKMYVSGVFGGLPNYKGVPDED
jgi:hypothetical protein